MWLGNTELVEVAHVSMSESWEWACLDILYDRETRTYYQYRDSGCSCSYAYEHVYSVEDLEELEGRFDALNRLTQYIKNNQGDSFWSFDAVKALGEVEKLANFKEESA